MLIFILPKSELIQARKIVSMDQKHYKAEENLQTPEAIVYMWDI